MSGIHDCTHDNADDNGRERLVCPDCGAWADTRGLVERGWLDAAMLQWDICPTI